MAHEHEMTEALKTQAKRLEEIKQRCEKSTPEPWNVRTHPELPSFVEWRPAGRSHGIEILQQDDTNYQTRDEDVEFVAHARQDIPWLLEQVAAERARNLELRQAFSHIHKAKYDDQNRLLRECGSCGLDLTDGVHERVKP
jgi:hypothetical protein